jgi:hypothetical protein
MSDDDYSFFAEIRSLHDPLLKTAREKIVAGMILDNIAQQPHKLIYQIFGKDTAPDWTAEFEDGRRIAIEICEIFNPERRRAIEHNHKLTLPPPAASKPRKIARSEVPIPNYQIWNEESCLEALNKAIEVKDEKLMKARASGTFDKIVLGLHTDEATLSVELVQRARKRITYCGINIDECYLQFHKVPGEDEYPIVRIF